MEKIYKKVRPGHIFQKERTAPGPIYSEEYVEYYNKIPSEKMSILRYEILKKYVGKFNKICDYGYGNGSFLKHCLKMGHDTFGYDISNYKLPKEIDVVENIFENEYDIISFFDSLEHIEQEDLIPFLSKLRTKYIIISLPWYHEFLGEKWFESWKHRKPNEHFHHFDSHGIIKLLDESGYRLLNISNEEDLIRKPFCEYPNIMTVVVRKVNDEKL